MYVFISLCELKVLSSISTKEITRNETKRNQNGKQFSMILYVGFYGFICLCMDCYEMGVSQCKGFRVQMEKIYKMKNENTAKRKQTGFIGNLYISIGPGGTVVLCPYCGLYG